MRSEIQNAVKSRWTVDYPIVFQNSSGEDIPAYACMQVSGSTTFGSDRVLTVTKPNGNSSARYIFNAPTTVPYQSYSAATEFTPSDALITGAPAVNQELGPTAGSWLLSVNGKGFQYLGGLAGGVGRVAAKSGGDDFPIVKIVNVSGLPRSKGNIVGYGPVVDAWSSYARIPTFQSAAPIAGRPFAVLLGDIGVGNTGDAVPVGTAETTVNYTDATHEYAEAITNDYSKLASANSGQARILARQLGGLIGPSSLGIQAARVRLDPLTSPPSAPEKGVRAVSTTTSSAAAGFVGGSLTPGTGQARLYASPANTNAAAGTAWTLGATVTYETWMHTATVANKPILLRESRRLDNGTIIYELITEGCAEVPTSGGG